MGEPCGSAVHSAIAGWLKCTEHLYARVLVPSWTCLYAAWQTWPTEIGLRIEPYSCDSGICLRSDHAADSNSFPVLSSLSNRVTAHSTPPSATLIEATLGLGVYHER